VNRQGWFLKSKRSQVKPPVPITAAPQAMTVAGAQFSSCSEPMCDIKEIERRSDSIGLAL
jgi:hypothetical protein